MKFLLQLSVCDGKLLLYLRAIMDFTSAFLVFLFSEGWEIYDCELTFLLVISFSCDIFFLRLCWLNFRGSLLRLSRWQGSCRVPEALSTELRPAIASDLEPGKILSSRSKRKTLSIFRDLKQIALKVLANRASTHRVFKSIFSVIIINFLFQRVRNAAVERTSNYWIKMCHSPRMQLASAFLLNPRRQKCKNFQRPEAMRYWNNSEITLSEI